MTTVENTPGAQPAPQPAGTTAAPELAGQPPAHGGAPASADGTTTPEGAAPQAPAAPQDPNEPEPKWKGRFSDLTKQRNEAAERAAEERGRRLAMEELMQRGFNPQPQPQPAPAPAEAPDPEPNPNNYPGKDWDPKYQADRIAWGERQVEKRVEAKFRAEQETARVKAEQQTAFQRGKAQFDDALAFCQQAADVTPDAAAGLQTIARTLPNEVVDIITDPTEQNPHLIAEYLQRNPQEIAQFQRELRSGPHGAFRVAARLGAISQYFAAQAARSAAPQPSNTPAAVPQVVNVPTPVNGAGGGSFDPNTASMEDYARWRSNQR